MFSDMAFLEVLHGLLARALESSKADRHVSCIGVACTPPSGLVAVVRMADSAEVTGSRHALQARASTNTFVQSMLVVLPASIEDRG
jgi:hypothetical protein